MNFVTDLTALKKISQYCKNSQSENSQEFVFIFEIQNGINEKYTLQENLNKLSFVFLLTHCISCISTGLLFINVHECILYT